LKKYCDGATPLWECWRGNILKFSPCMPRLHACNVTSAFINIDAALIKRKSPSWEVVLAKVWTNWLNPIPNILNINSLKNKNKKEVLLTG
jgi:hypothetical protein